MRRLAAALLAPFLLAALSGCAPARPSPEAPWLRLTPSERTARVAAAPGLDSRLVRYNQGQIEFVEARPPAGSGDPALPPVVFIHGLGGTFGSFGPALIAADPTSIRIAVNLPGTGRSTGPPESFSIPAFARALRELLVVRMGHPKLDLVCHSLGGQVCMAFALDFPAHVASLTLIDAAGSYDRSEFVKRMAKHYAGVNLGDVLVSDHPAIEMLTGGNLNIINRIVGGNASVLAALNSFDQNYRGRIPGINVPVLIIWGRDDPIFTVDNGFFLRNNIRGSRLRVVPGAGHSPQLSHADLVSGWIQEFRRSVAAGSRTEETHANP